MVCMQVVVYQLRQTVSVGQSLPDSLQLCRADSQTLHASVMRHMAGMQIAESTLVPQPKICPRSVSFSGWRY